MIEDVVAHYEVTGKNLTELRESADEHAQKLFPDSDEPVLVVLDRIGVDQYYRDGMGRKEVALWSAEVMAGTHKALYKRWIQ